MTPHLLNNFRTYLFTGGLLICSFSQAQVVDGFTSWTQRNQNGDYTQSTTAGTWSMIDSRVFRTTTGGLPYNGLVEISKRATDSSEGGIFSTPVIAKGGASSIEVSILMRSNVAQRLEAIVEVQKSVDGLTWETLETLKTASSTSSINLINVNDSRDNLRFRFVSKSIYNPVIVDYVKVNHLFNIASSNSVICSGDGVTLSTNSSAPFNYTWSSSAGGNLNQTTGNSVTANPTQNATYTAVGTYTTAFGTVTSTKTIDVVVRERPSATISGSGTISLDPQSVNLAVAFTGEGPWSFTYTANGTNPQTVNGITTSPYTLVVSPEVTTTYQLTNVSNANCTGTVNGTASVEVTKTIWKLEDAVAKWSNGTPTAAKNTYIYEPFVTATDGVFTSKELTVNNNGKVTISANTSLLVEKITNNLSADRFVVESDANLLQSSNQPNTGNIIVDRVANMAKAHFNFWSSPVANQNLYEFSDGGAVGGTPKRYFYHYNEANNYFVSTGINNSYTFKTGQGYAIRGKDSYSADYTVTNPYTYTFIGNPNNGNLQFESLKWSNAEHGFNMIGNPYPSNLDFDALYDQNSSLIYGTAYFWTNQEYIAGQQGSEYEGSNYAIYNRSGGVPAAYQNGVSSPIPTQYIKVGQGFIVQTMNGANNQPLQFNNSMRSDNSSSVFFNRTNQSKDRFWLNLKSPSNINNTILVAYVNGATDQYERSFDADVLIMGSDAFYSILGASKLAIQGRAYPLVETDIVTLGSKFAEDGVYQISLGKKEGIFDEYQTIYLRDNVNNQIINLSEVETYSFNATKGTDESRFEVLYVNNNINNQRGVDLSNVSVIKSEELVLVRDSKENIKSVDIYDATGKLVKTLSNLNAQQIEVSSVGLIKGVYILKISSEKGKITTKKIVL